MWLCMITVLRRDLLLLRRTFSVCTLPYVPCVQRTRLLIDSAGNWSGARALDSVSLLVSNWAGMPCSAKMLL